MICTLGREAVGGDRRLRCGVGRCRRARRSRCSSSGRGTSASAAALDAATVTAVFPAASSYARNRGLATARAPLVAFVDDDEVVDAGWVARLFATFERVRGLGGLRPDRAAGRPRAAVLPLRRRGRAARRRRPRAPALDVGTGGNMAFGREDLVAARRLRHALRPRRGRAVGRGHRARSSACCARGRRSRGRPTSSSTTRRRSAEERLASRFPYAYGIGKLARRHRDPVLAARYAKAIVENDRPARSARGTGGGCARPAQTLCGFVAGVGRRARPRLAEAAARGVPDEIARGARRRPRRGARPLLPSRPALHVRRRQASGSCTSTSSRRPSARRARGAGADPRGSPAAGHPRLHRLWRGRRRAVGARGPPSGRRSRGPATWGTGSTEAASWALELGGPPGPPVREGSWWADEATAAVEVAPPELRGAAVVGRARDASARSRRAGFTATSSARTSSSTGDGGIGVVDWERAYEDGPPGLDLLFLALMATGRPARPRGSCGRSRRRRAGVGAAAATTWARAGSRASICAGTCSRRWRCGPPNERSGPRRWACRSARSERYLELLLDVGPALA